ncbi:MAG: nucleotidyl transferase AbiEii/AbiGii toxin family protein [Phycisphaerales bacterium JB063]
MTPPIEILARRLVDDLQDAGASFALVGGLAIGARTGPRFTRDVDLAISVASDHKAEQVLGHLIQRGYRPQAEINQDRAGRLATMRLIAPFDTGADPEEGNPIADIICATCGIEPEIVAAATPVTIAPDLTVPTARIPHLIAMKVLSESDERLQDRLDLQALLAASTEEDRSAVPPLLDLIAQRGYHRGKDLRATLAAFHHER